MKKGNIYINKDGVNKVISPEDFPIWEAEGWVRGNTNCRTAVGRTPWNKGLSKDTDERLQSVSQKKLGSHHTDAVRKKLSENHKGKKPSAETVEKRRQKMLGHEVSEDTRRKISEARKGHPVSQESIQKALATRKANGHWYHTEEAKRKISEAQKGKKPSDEVRRIANEKRRQTCLEKYGVEYFVQSNDCKVKFNRVSIPNKLFRDLLTQNNIIFEPEFSLASYRYDNRVDNTLIEIDPSPTHNSTFCPFSDTGLDKRYHLNKSINAEMNGYRCIHVFDWDDPQKIINLLQKKTAVYARKCDVQLITDKEVINQFLEAYHLQGTCRNQTICYGLYYDSELVQVMTFGKPRYNSNYQYELLRLCTKAGITVVGGASKLFSTFINTYTPESIISYCDRSKFTGDIYYQLGFTKLTSRTPSRHWVNLKTLQHITDNLLRARGFDQLFNTNYGKGTDNDALMLSAGFVEVYDCGQETFVWKNDS